MAELSSPEPGQWLFINHNPTIIKSPTLSIVASINNALMCTIFTFSMSFTAISSQTPHSAISLWPYSLLNSLNKPPFNSSLIPTLKKLPPFNGSSPYPSKHILTHTPLIITFSTSPLQPTPFRPPLNMIIMPFQLPHLILHAHTPLNITP